MEERRIILTWEAIYDITDIADYIEAEFGTNRADKFQEDMNKQLKEIGYAGEGFGNTQLFYRTHSIFKKAFPPSIIFYVIKEPKKEVHILRVLREERDWKSILQKDTKYTYPE